jgi:hypothetical protein
MASVSPYSAYAPSYLYISRHSVRLVFSSNIANLLKIGYHSKFGANNDPTKHKAFSVIRTIPFKLLKVKKANGAQPYQEARTLMCVLLQSYAQHLKRQDVVKAQRRRSEQQDRQDSSCTITAPHSVPEKLTGSADRPEVIQIFALSLSYYVIT